MTTHDHNDSATAPKESRGTVPDRVSAGLADVAGRLAQLTGPFPRHGDDAAWATRSAGLALTYARRAGWWGVLVSASRADPTVPYAYARAAWIARDQSRRDARFWRETARDYQARADGRPTSDAAGALSNWNELGGDPMIRHVIRDHGAGDWRNAAACTRVDPEIFYPVDETPGSPAVTRAKRVCASCPVRKICLADVMAGEDPARRWGITGGLTPAERTARYARERHLPPRTGAVAA